MPLEGESVVANAVVNLDSLGKGDEVPGLQCRCAKGKCWRVCVSAKGFKFLGCPYWTPSDRGCGTLSMKAAEALLNGGGKSTSQKNLITASRFDPGSFYLHYSNIFPYIDHDGLDPDGLKASLYTGLYAQNHDNDEKCLQSVPELAHIDVAKYDEAGIKWISNLVAWEEEAFSKTAERQAEKLLPTPYELPPTLAQRAAVFYLSSFLQSKNYSIPKIVKNHYLRGAKNPLDNSPAGGGANAATAAAGNSVVLPSPFVHFPSNANQVSIEWCDGHTRLKCGYDLKLMIHFKWLNVKIVDMWQPEYFAAFQYLDTSGNYGWLFGHADIFMVPKSPNPCLSNPGEWIFIEAAALRALMLTEMDCFNKVELLHRTCAHVQYEWHHFHEKAKENAASSSSFVEAATASAAPVRKGKRILEEEATSSISGAEEDELHVLPAKKSKLTDEQKEADEQSSPSPPSPPPQAKDHYCTVGNFCGTCAGIEASPALKTFAGAQLVSLETPLFANDEDATKRFHGTFYRVSLTGGRHADQFMVASIADLESWCRRSNAIWKLPNAVTDARQ